MIDPAWPFGVAFIIVAVSVRRALPQLLRSIADRNSDHARAEPAIPTEEVEDLRRRLGELEERVDFAERLLTQQREMAKLPEPGR